MGGLNTFSAEGIANLLSEFIYKPEEGMIFPVYFKRYKTIFAKRCQSWSNEENIMLVLQKLGTHEKTKYTNYILPNKPEEMLFEETIETLSKMFGEWDSLFHTRYKCLNIIKEDDEDFVAYAGKVNAQCERFGCLYTFKDSTDKSVESLKAYGQKTYRRQYYLLTLPRHLIPFTEGRWNKSY